MKKHLFLILFLVGLAIFSYPMISNIFSTKAHQSVVREYEETVQSLDAEQIVAEKEKAKAYNEQLAGVQTDFVDPFSEGSGGGADRSYYDALNIGPAIGSVEIPKLNEELPIYHGTSEEVLSQGVGHLEKSSLPTGGPGTHSVLTAHRGLPSAKLFRNLNDLAVGDRFYVRVLGETLAYEVSHTDIVLPEETDWLQMNEGEDLVTLLTCDPYMINTHRMLVTGKRIPYEPEALEVSAQQQAEDDDRSLIFYASVAALFILAIAWFEFRRRKKRMKANEES